MSKESSHPTPLSVCRPRRAGGRHRAPRRPSPLGRALALAVATGLAGVTPLVVGVAPASADVNWDAVAQCESGGRWQVSTGNGFYGGLQFTRSTWLGNGGGSYASSPHHATREQQIAVANRVLRSQGIGAWPTCGKRGYSRSSHRSLSSSSGSSYQRDALQGESSRSYHRKSSRSKWRQSESSGYRSRRHSGSSTGTRHTWQRAESTENRLTRSNRTHYKRRVVVAPPKRVAAMALIPAAVPDFLPRRMFSAVAQPAQRRTLKPNYVVRPGDNLVVIATDHKLAWQALYARNRAVIGANPNMIAPGLRLVIG
jgi:hypothetical protein